MTKSTTVQAREWMARIAAGDRQAFSELVTTYQDLVYNLALRLLENPVEAQDVAQDVFVKAYHAAGGFRGESSIQTWLYRITVNECHKWRRKRRWERLASVFHAEAVPQWQSGASSPQAELEQSERRALVQRALARLPESQRTLLILHRWEGLSYREIAEVTGQSLSAVESKLHRAYKKLGKLLEEWLG